jgi:hypothetical protein
LLAPSSAGRRASARLGFPRISSGGRSALRSAGRGPNHCLTAKAGNGPGLRQGDPQARTRAGRSGRKPSGRDGAGRGETYEHWKRPLGKPARRLPQSGAVRRGGRWKRGRCARGRYRPSLSKAASDEQTSAASLSSQLTRGHPRAGAGR